MDSFSASSDSFCEPDSPYLFTTEHGAVLQCSCCGRLQLMFDDIVLLLTRRDFRCLHKAVASAMQRIEDAPPSWWRLAAPGSPTENSVRVHSEEVEALHELLCGAAAMLELDVLLEKTVGQ